MMMANSTPIIFIPGMLCDARLWQPLTAALENRFQPSHLLVDAPNLEQWASQCIQSLPKGAILAGLSMGGYAALEIMRQLHEAGRAGEVLGLILMATSARADTPEQSRIRRGLIQLAKRGTFKGVTPKLLPTLIHHSLIDQPEPAETIFAMANEMGDAAFIAQETAVMERRSQLDMLKDIQCPTLIICGDSDQRTPPECSAEMHEHITGSDYHLVTDCGHLPPLERPEEVKKILASWLAERF